MNLTQFTVLNMTISHGSVRSYVCIPLLLLRAFPYTPLLNSAPSPYEGNTSDSKEEKMDVERAQHLSQCCPAGKAEAATNQTTRKVGPHQASETMIPASQTLCLWFSSFSEVVISLRNEIPLSPPFPLHWRHCGVCFQLQWELKSSVVSSLDVVGKDHTWCVIRRHQGPRTHLVMYTQGPSEES